MELFIKDILIELGFVFHTEETFSDLRNPKTNALLKFDFSIPSRNMIIEYDGKQHYEVISIWGDVETLKETQYRDSLKNEYCQKNNIHLVRFNYKESPSHIRNTLEILLA
jgi:very-short-patch-repair endonuclease